MRRARPREVNIKITAVATVILLRKGVAPVLPKTVWLEPPKAAPMLAPFPFCNRTIMTSAIQTTTWSNVRTRTISPFLSTSRPLSGQNRTFDITKKRRECNKNHGSSLNRTTGKKDSGFRLAPPTRAPSMSGFDMRSRTLSGLTLPP
jgi:hypothetical protein